MERRSFLKAMAAAIAFPFAALKAKAVSPQVVTDPRLIPTRWPAFDEALGGGLPTGEFTVFLHDEGVDPRLFFTHMTQGINGWDQKVALWKFEPDLTQVYSNKYLTNFVPIGQQMSRWYRIRFPMMAENQNVLVISPHQMRARIVCADGSVPALDNRGVSRVCEYYGSVVIKAESTDTPNVVRYTITKNRQGWTYPAILVHHGFWGAKQIEVIHA
jgi:hypothetical protein